MSGRSTTVTGPGTGRGGPETLTRGRAFAAADSLSSSPDEQPRRRVDLWTDRPHSARVYDYWLGKDNYAAGRVAADAVLAQLPAMRSICRANRAFMARAARAVVDAGVDQFLDVGTGIPTVPDLHQVVQACAPNARVVYVDHDPVVLAHAAALMRGNSAGATAYVQADARAPARRRSSRPTSCGPRSTPPAPSASR